MAEKIRLGIIGANSQMGWAPRSHLPAVVASPEFELTAVCTTRQESAEESARLFGAKMAFHDYHDMLAHPDVDAVAVVLRVPSHYNPTRDAINAGKAVFTEWPLGRTTAEATELAALAKAKGIKTAVGLQARMSPVFMYVKDLITSGFVGDVMSSHISQLQGGVLERTSGRTWQRDAVLGANTLTIANGHTIDAFGYVAGGFRTISSVVSTQAKQWMETDTKKLVDVTSPDNVIISGRLAGGGVVSSHVASVPWAGSGYRMEIYGTDGTLAVSGDESPQIADLRLQGTQGKNPLKDMEVPSRYMYVSESMPKGSPYNVGQLYFQFAKSIRTGSGDHPDFDTAVTLHHLVDAIAQSSDTGTEIEVHP